MKDTIKEEQQKFDMLYEWKDRALKVEVIGEASRDLDHNKKNEFVIISIGVNGLKLMNDSNYCVSVGLDDVQLIISPLSGRNQEIQSRFVNRDVYLCVTGMVNEILTTDSDYITYDDIQNYYSYPELHNLDLGLWFPGGSQEDLNSYCDKLDERHSELSNKGTGDLSEIELLESFIFDLENLEAEDQEIYEWWAVDRSLFDDLISRGEPGIDLGNTFIWGRTTTGQAIMVDSVIHSICKDLEILEGQKYEWK